MKKIIVFGVFCMALNFVSFSQDTNTDNHTLTVTVPEVALLDLEAAGSKNFGLTFTGPKLAGLAEAGLRIANPLPNATIWINYSSIVTASGPDVSRDVNVTSSIGAPGGVNLTATAAPTSVGAGGGVTGTGISNVTIDNTVQPIVTGIGSCYTGNGPTNGHLLTYNASVQSGSANYSLLVAGVTPMIITYTLTDNP